MKCVSNDYPNPNTNPTTLTALTLTLTITTLTLTLTDPHGLINKFLSAIPSPCGMKIRPAWKSIQITLNRDIDGQGGVVIGFRD